MGQRTDEALGLLAPVEAAIGRIPLPGADHDKPLGAFYALQNSIIAFGRDEVTEGSASVNVNGLPTATTVSKEEP